MASLTRHRNRSSESETYEYHDYVQTYTKFGRGANTWTHYEPRSTTFVPRFESMSDTLTPSYYEIIRNKLLLPYNPMIKVSEIVESPAALTIRKDYISQVRYYRGQPYWYTNAYEYSHLSQAPAANNPTNFEGYKKSVEDAAMNATLAALNGPIAQSLVTVGELGESIRLILGAKKRFLKLFRDLFMRRQHYSKSKKKYVWSRKKDYDRSVLDASADAYMEGRYGWRPLVGEIDSYIDAALRNLKPGFRVISRSRTFESREEVDVSDITVGGITYSRKQISEYEYRAKVSIGYTLNLDAIEEWFHRLGITSWKSAVWELIPLSFVADMFVNIGDTISALDENPSIKITQSGMTTTMKVTSHYEYKFKYHPPNQTDGDGTTYFPIPSFTGPKREVVYYDRAATPAEVKLPSITMDLDLLQWLDVSVIAKQLFSKLGK